MPSNQVSEARLSLSQVKGVKPLLLLFFLEEKGWLGRGQRWVSEDGLERQKSLSTSQNQTQGQGQGWVSSQRPHVTQTEMHLLHGVF